MHTDAIAEPDECYLPLSPERVQKLKIELDIWSEAEVRGSRRGGTHLAEPKADRR